MTATTLPTTTPDQIESALVLAASALAAGDVVAVTTETVYGLAANAWDMAAVAKIFALKGRPSHNPLPPPVPRWAPGVRARSAPRRR